MKKSTIIIVVNTNNGENQRKENTIENNVENSAENSVEEEFVDVLDDGTKLNTSGSDKQAMLIDVILYDKNKNEITTLGGRISPIKAGQTMQFSTSAMIDYANAYDFEFRLKQ